MPQPSWPDFVNCRPPPLAPRAAQSEPPQPETFRPPLVTRQNFSWHPCLLKPWSVLIFTLWGIYQVPSCILRTWWLVFAHCSLISVVSSSKAETTFRLSVSLLHRAHTRETRIEVNHVETQSRNLCLNSQFQTFTAGNHLSKSSHLTNEKAQVGELTPPGLSLPAALAVLWLLCWHDCSLPWGGLPVSPPSSCVWVSYPPHVVPWWLSVTVTPEMQSASGAGSSKFVGALPEWTPGGNTAGQLQLRIEQWDLTSRLEGTMETLQFSPSFLQQKKPRNRDQSDLPSNYWGASESSAFSARSLDFEAVEWVTMCVGLSLPADDLIRILFCVSRSNDAVWNNFPAVVWLTETPMVMWLQTLLGLVECSV